MLEDMKSFISRMEHTQAKYTEAIEEKMKRMGIEQQEAIEAAKAELSQQLAEAQEAVKKASNQMAQLEREVCDVKEKTKEEVKKWMGIVNDLRRDNAAKDAEVARLSGQVQALERELSEARAEARGVTNRSEQARAESNDTDRSPVLDVPMAPPRGEQEQFETQSQPAPHAASQDQALSQQPLFLAPTDDSMQPLGDAVRVFCFHSNIR